MTKSLSWRSSRTEVRDSPIHGRGLFATAPIAAGDVVAVKGGYVYEAGEWLALAGALEPMEIQIDESLFLAPADPAQREGGMVFTNHCCDPNIAIQGQIVFVAMRGIDAGEELTVDWATIDDLDYEIECRCGSPRCRGVVTGRDWMKPELQARYRGWFCWFIQRKIDRGEFVTRD